MTTDLEMQNRMHVATIEALNEKIEALSAEIEALGAALKLCNESCSEWANMYAALANTADKLEMQNRMTVPLEDLEIGSAYKLDARNIQVGIWDGRSFHGIRRKFGDTFMDDEIHYDLDDRYGTAHPVRKLV